MTTTDERSQTKPIAQFLREHAGGRLHDEASEKLAQLVSAVNETGNKGTLTIVLKVAPMKGMDDGVLQVTDDVKLKAPEGPRSGTLFYADDEGNLHRENPRQQRIPGVVAAVPDADTEPVELAQAETAVSV